MCKRSDFVFEMHEIDAPLCYNISEGGIVNEG